MKLFVIRHTKVAIEQGICYGQTDVPVAESFHDEKAIIANQLKGIHFNKVYSSPLSRCKILAESLFENEAVIFDDRLKELNFGDWELKTWDEIYNSPKGKIWMDNYQIRPTLNGESYPEMVKRISEFYAEMISREADNVAIFTHAGPIRILKSIIENESIEELFKTFKPEYGSVISFKI